MLVTADLASPCKTILLDLAKKSRRDLLSPARHTCSTLLKHASCKDLQGHANSHHLLCLAKLFCKNGFLGRHTRFSSYHFLNLNNIQMFYATCCFWFSVICGQLSSWSSFIFFPYSIYHLTPLVSWSLSLQSFPHRTKHQNILFYWGIFLWGCLIYFLGQYIWWVHRKKIMSCFLVSVLIIETPIKYRLFSLN